MAALIPGGASSVTAGTTRQGSGSHRRIAQGGTAQLHRTAAFGGRCRRPGIVRLRRTDRHEQGPRRRRQAGWRRGQGEAYFNALCAGCRGTGGKKIKDAPLGAVANNAREMMYKVLNGQPAEAMTALRVLDHQVTADIVVHLQTLPK